MAIQARNVYHVDFAFPDDQKLIHPVIVISIEEVCQAEGTFIGIPISHTPNPTELCFPLTDSMFKEPLKGGKSYAKLHLITFLHIDQIQGRINDPWNIMKPVAFKNFMQEVFTLVFGFDIEF
ncbi:hypothetical protein [Deminuibacter soli]|uniref:Type II toxin-antitoxin system PemK/MazF family toxin n=1 Tax=Deminuibacter soli TaxID=2291815 RepID=A0A3E1NEM7_9BACT|nr:hypothetical protein [Deminuibacter soli]RFM26254.1 hypothetical protein DXN05_20295 [Deminuibacter soli]